MISGLVFVLLMCCVSLYVGNYLYDYTLNPYSQHNISEKIETNDEVAQASRQWLNQNSVNVSLENQEHLNLYGRYIDQGSSVYVIMVHGYRGDGASIISPIKNFKKQGYNLLIPDLRGHGQSEGDYIGMGWDDRLDIMQWIEYILGKDKQASIVLYGVSMGAATVMNVAGENIPHQVKAIIEDCGYTSVWDVFKSHINMNDLESEIALHMASFVTKMRAGYYLEDVKPIEQVKKSHTPMLFIHGSQDNFVPFLMLNELYEAANCPKEKLIIEGAGHANSCSVGEDIYYQTVFDFINKYIQERE
ncbi:alpha/beta hydrolase [Candidatus Stoquefichus massiliensis]|uniref:alpha/beta hydrolase n=1 Tax=Candidatus Stoquefichus massiliensis TaxID=1470350 RepID=UPI001E505B0B|nr:alpha/beta hydrolase [Candidatus Stoquefichus massiliensis]